MDIQAELNERDQLIEQLTEQLQLSVADREELQRQGEKLTGEVEILKRQLADTLDLLKKPPQWKETVSCFFFFNFSEKKVISNLFQSSQRLSQVSIDLVSDFDDDDAADRQPLDLEFDLYNQSVGEISQEIENFKRLLKVDELKLFAVVQRKFDEYFREELEKLRSSHDNELKILRDQVESEKQKNETSLSQIRTELQAKHTQEMEKLRTYFEQKCTDLEKQYSEEVFSQHSRRHSVDTTGSDVSDQENLPDENAPTPPSGTPKKHKTALLSSPTHRKITPTSMSPSKRVIKTTQRSASAEVAEDKVYPVFEKYFKFTNGLARLSCYW